MKYLLTKSCITILFLFSVNKSFSQEFKNDAAEREKHFVYQVKQIDEFFERFNDDPNSFIREVYKSYKVKYNLDRKKLIKSLFNYQGKSWSQNLIDSFVEKALLAEMPTAKKWYGDNWFAEVNCKFQHNSEIIDIPVILQIMTDEKNRSKWIIVGVGSNSLKESQHADIPITVRTIKTRFISPVDHGTNFIELDKAFSDKDHLSDYFENSFFYRSNAVQFYHAILNGHIRLLFVKDVKYHFLNVEGYIFTVEYFQRESKNSGWLINTLKTAKSEEKETYKKQLLGE